MVVMVGWFSIKRLLGWIFFFSCILVTLLWTTKLMVGDMMVVDNDRARRTIIAKRKAQEKLSSELPPPAVKKAEPLSSKSVFTAPPKKFIPDSNYYFRPMPSNILIPFTMNYEQMSKCFTDFERENGTDVSLLMEKYLLEKFGAVAIPATQIKSPKKRFIMSLLRHVTLFFNEFKVRSAQGGTAQRDKIYYEIPSCKSVGLEGREGEILDGTLNELAGSQASLFIKNFDFPLTLSDELPFLEQVNGKGQYKMISKYFTSYKKKRAKNESYSEEEQGEDGAPMISLSKELFALSKLKWNPNILTPVCYEKTPTLKLIFPLLNGGDMIPVPDEKMDYCMGGTRPLNPDETFLPRFFRQAVEALLAIHSEGILHLDIKPENLLIHGPDRQFIHPADSPALRNYNLVFIDFGISRRIEDIKEDECIQEGTEPQMAPEQIICHYSTGRSADWWSLAATMWRIRVLWEPSLTESARGELSESKDPHWGHYSTPMQPFMDPQFVDLLNLMLKPNPIDRDFSRDQAASNVLLNHPYLLRGKQ